MADCVGGGVEQQTIIKAMTVAAMVKKDSKTKKSPKKGVNQQQHLDKNDFSAWKAPLSPLASL
ncbi:hypothetical protein [uncultured Limnohabitans sp.]|jgi:hypothetical protein|uniref:hypothetical protein n=1 Tax=uncultured Limnohabitans sp. TaxID=768543 RepID=UPI00261AD4F8|nr:hypothetical protein [uncultured Limnohabitans sp.]